MRTNTTFASCDVLTDVSKLSDIISSIGNGIYWSEYSFTVLVSNVGGSGFGGEVGPVQTSQRG